MRGTHGINTVVGVILDGKTAALKGFLSEIPAHRQLLALMRQARGSRELFGWDKREKWCRQLVQAVAKVHTKGFVIGILGDGVKDGVGLDGFNNVVLYRFRSTFYAKGTATGESPLPECPHAALTKESMPALPQTDIYQLGFLLWRIATHMEATLGSSRAEDTPGSQNAEGTGTNSNGYAVDLPLVDSIPQYLRNVIAACRTENPTQRPPAWKLLEMFPSRLDSPLESLAQNQSGKRATSVQNGQSEQLHRSENLMANDSQQYPMTLEEIYKGRPHTCVCSLCGTVTTEGYFHCGVCQAGDFDLCPRVHV